VHWSDLYWKGSGASASPIARQLATNSVNATANNDGDDPGDFDDNQDAAAEDTVT